MDSASGRPEYSNDTSSRIQELEKQVRETRLLKESIEDRLRFEKLLFEISTAYSSLPAVGVEKNIRKDQERISKMLGADRCTLSQISKNKNGLNFLYAWADKNLPTQDDTYLETQNYFPWCMSKLKRGKDIIFKSLDELPDEAAFDKQSFTYLSVQAHISVPIQVGGEVMYVFSISYSSPQRSWPEEQIQRLRLVGEIFSNALIRKQKELDIQNAFTEIKHLKDQLEADCTYLREEIDLEHNAYEMIGQSDQFKHLLLKIQQVASTDITVLVQGETGTGKELVARAIHAASTRSRRPMVKVNCASLPANLIESELFGHEKGAFTSADARQVGRFELANGNSLFLDEIGELPKQSQAKLLRVLHDGEFERLGSSRTIKVDVRIIAATNRDLEEEVEKGRFRRDLWYRLNVFPVSVPPLRERTDDIPLLTHWFTKEISRKLGRTISRIPSKTIHALQNYHWPGNIRELRNVVERAVINTTGNALQLMDPLSPTPLNTEPLLSGIKPLQRAERDHIIQALKFTNWRISGKKGAAALLDINPSTLRTRMKKLGIQKTILLRQD